MANKTKAQLLAEAKELGLELTEQATNAEIQAAIDKANEPAVEDPETERAEAAQKAQDSLEAGIEEEKRGEDAAEKRVEEREQASSEAAVLAEAIKDSFGGSKKAKGFTVATDDSIVPQFAVVKNDDGEVMIRENSTGTLSKVQLESLEEKQASLQNQKVQEV